METLVTTGSENRRRRRRPRRKKPKDSEIIGKRGSKSPSRRLSIKETGIKKNVQNKVTEQYLDSVIQAYESQILSVRNQENWNCVKSRLCEINLEQTVDLCNDDSSVDSSNSSLLIVSPQVKPKNEVVYESNEIDLGRDLSEQNEVIDLTEPTGMTADAASSLGPTVIDITEDDPKDNQNVKAKTEEIFVLGTFTNCSINNVNNTNNIPLVKLSNRWNNLNNIINCSNKLKKKYFKKHSNVGNICDKSIILGGKKAENAKGNSCSSKVAVIGENVYINSPVTLPSSGLRPIIIDGSNVAYVYSNSNFCCKRLEICINYFKERGHKVTAFVPQFRINNQKSDDPGLLRKLERRGDVVLTPSKKIDGKNIVPYDDRFIVQTAVLKGGIIVTRDNYNDLLKENPAWAETIKYRTLAFTWVDDVLMFPKDPLGEHGPSLEEFLKFH